MSEIPPKDRALFLGLLRLEPNVTKAARAAGYAPATLRRLRERDPGFGAEWDEALDEGIEALEAEAHRRAKDGVLRPIYQKGDLVGHETVYSDQLIMFLLKAHRPEKYRERSDVKSTQGGVLKLEVITGIPEDLPGSYAHRMQHHGPHAIEDLVEGVDVPFVSERREETPEEVSDAG